MHIVLKALSCGGRHSRPTPTTIDRETTIDTHRWGDETLTIEVAAPSDAPAAVSALELGGRRVEVAHRVPVLDVLTMAGGHVPASDRLVDTALGAQLRLRRLEHSRPDDAGSPDQVLVLHLAGDPDVTGGLEAEVVWRRRPGTTTVRAETVLHNTGVEPVVLRHVTSWATGLGGDPVGAGLEPTDDWRLVHGHSDWLGEGRWRTTALDGAFPTLFERLTGHDPRSSLQAASGGTWSTGGALPVAALASERLGLAWMWQVETNGAWRWDVGQDTAGCWFAAAGPTDADAAWTRVLAPGESFTTVPVSVAVAVGGVEDALAAMTRHRRTLRRPHRDNAALPVVFNDYMNTLDGDPTTAKLLPLVTAAAEAGAEIFCIDAGWYDDSGHWWDTVGEWLPSTTRFPGGLDEVLDEIRRQGMTAGLWLEPEVVGVRSPVADTLPDSAFIRRHGVRVVEHGRYHLDLRDAAARAHLDAVVDRLVDEHGVGFLKLDYNIDPATGSDDGDSTGDGLLGHNRAHLAWLDGVLDRHPHLVLENCASGAMRMDPAMLSRLAMQSTSDQQEPTAYPPIAAAAPMMMPPEQAASWAYPQPGMAPEQAAFCLVTGLLGRFYLSGFLSEMTEPERALVHEAVTAARSLRAELPGTVPLWPLGLPGWDDPWVALGLDGPDGVLLSVWRRGGDDKARLHLPHLAGSDVTVEPVFPTGLEPWGHQWDAETGVLTLSDTPAAVSARTVRLRATAAGRGGTPPDRRPAAGAPHRGAPS